MYANHRYYKGKIACHGCGCTGSEKPREKRDILCNDCQKLISKGKICEIDTSIEYVQAQLVNNIFGMDRDLEEFVVNLLKVIERKDKNGYSYFVKAGGHWLDRTPRITIPLSVAKYLDENIAALREKRQNVVDTAYLRGKSEGSNLLMQLSTGDVTLDDFNKIVVKNDQYTKLWKSDNTAMKRK